MMKPALQLKLSQHLTLTPQLQQAIRLLQLSTLELKQELENYLRDNPLLEREDETPEEGAGGAMDFSGIDGTSREPDGNGERGERSEGDEMFPAADAPASSERDEDSWGGDGAYSEESYFSASSASGASDDDDRDFQEIQAAASKLADHLSWQLGLTPLSDRDRALVRLLIDALDEDGYLTLSLDELAQMLPAEMEVEPEELRAALGLLQHFDPPGVGARNAQECLQLQLAARRAENEARDGNGAEDENARSRAYDLAREIVSSHLEQLAARDFAHLKKLAGGDEETLRAAHRLILSLNPRPGARYAALEARYITPDVIVKKIRGEWQVQINPAAYPRLKINRLYADICASQRGSTLSGQLQEARWLLKNVQQRFDTITRVAEEIVRRQRGFFDHGEVAMRPLILREIAEALELHESTISRVTTQKYMATPRGIFELKYFFGSHVATDVGGACSATAIRALIKQLIAAEDKKKPVSDNKITEILGQQGIVVARRTVAKYREMLNIPPANLRKSL